MAKKSASQNVTSGLKEEGEFLVLWEKQDPLDLGEVWASRAILDLAVTEDRMEHKDHKDLLETLACEVNQDIQVTMEFRVCMVQKVIEEQMGIVV